MRVKVFRVSPGANVTLEGTPAQSALVAPFIPVAVMGTTVWVAGCAVQFDGHERSGASFIGLIAGGPEGNVD